MTDMTQRMVEAGARAIYDARVRGYFRWDDASEGNKNRSCEFARACLAAVHAAGFAVVPVEMTDEQARRSLDGNRLADRIRDVDPEHFARLVESRRATWRQLVTVMKEAEV
jgi:hypothetical protein